MANDPTLPEVPREPELDGSQTVDHPPPVPAAQSGTWADPAAAGNISETIDINPPPADAATGAWQLDKCGTSGATGDWHGDKSATEAATDAYLPSSSGIAGEASSTGRKQAAGDKVLPSPAPPGRFVLKNFHAKGGMGEVWVAEDTDIGRVVALKRIRSGREDKVDDFLHEAQITGQLEHPGVIPIHELGVNEQGQPFYVMKFVHGRTLRQAIDEYHGRPLTPTPLPGGERGTIASPLPAGERGRGEGSAVPREVQFLRLLQTFIDLCQTVAYAHSRNVLHRDIKPDNVMVGAYGETLVLDWGLAKIIGESDATQTLPSIHLTLSGDTQGTQFGSIKGTPGYIAPEVAEGRTRDVDQLSDVYLLGGTLYHILTGKKPRQAMKLQEMLEMARKRPIVPPRKLDATIPRPLEAICMRALAMRKQDRYASAQVLAEDMQRYLAGEPVMAYRETLVERAWRWIRKHRVLLGRVAAVVLVFGLICYGVMALAALEEQRQADLRKAADVLDAANIKAARDKKESDDRAAAARREADHLAKVDRAKADVKKFRQHAEMMRFYSVMYDNPAEREPMYGRAKAEEAGRQALAALAPWGKQLEHFPPDKEQLDKEKMVARQELYALLLMLAQTLMLRDQRPETAQTVLALLDHAVQLQPPSAGEHHLRAGALRVLKQLSQAADEDLKAKHKQTLLGAIDHYLLGEQELFEALRADAKPAAGQKVSRQMQLCGAAVEQYYKAVEMDPEFVWAYWQLGRCFSLLQEPKAAGQSLAGCAALRPVSAPGHTIRGVALVTLGRYDEAAATITHGMEMDLTFRPARLQRGWVYWLQKEYAKAKADLDAVLEPPDEERLLIAAYFRGQLYLETKEYAKALDDFNMVTTGPTTIRDAFLKRARVCFLLGKTEDGLKSIDAFLHSGRDGKVAEYEVHEFRGRQLHQLAFVMPDPAPHFKQALKELHQAIEQQPESAALFAELGTVQERLLDFDAAVISYGKALQFEPENLVVLVKRGWARDNTKSADPEASAKDFAAAVRLDPKHAEAHTGLGYMYACLKKTGLAERHAQQALLHGGGDYLVLHNVACIYAKLSSFDAQHGTEYEDRAIDLLERGVELYNRTKVGPDPVLQIQMESSFTPSMWLRPEFEKWRKKK
jgi:serine/threonine protein kinase